MENVEQRVEKHVWVVMDVVRQYAVSSFDLETGRVQIKDIQQAFPFETKEDAEKVRPLADAWAGGWPVFSVEKRVLIRRPVDPVIAGDKGRSHLEIRMTDDFCLEVELSLSAGPGRGKTFTFGFTPQEVDRILATFDTIHNRHSPRGDVDK